MSDISDLLPTPPPTENGGANMPGKSSLRPKLPLAPSAPDTANSPRWAVGVQAILIALVSIFAVMGFENIGPGIVDSWKSKNTVAEQQQVTVNTMLQSMQTSNQSLQNTLVVRDSRIKQLEDENRELKLLLQYRCNIEVTPVPTAPPILVPTSTLPADLVPAPTPQG